MICALALLLPAVAIASSAIRHRAPHRRTARFADARCPTLAGIDPDCKSHRRRH